MTITDPVFNGDTIPHMLRDMEAESVDFAITSVPFPAVFAYTDSVSDLGNSEGLDVSTRIHFSFFFRGLLRVLKPGRVACIHCTQIALTKRSGHEGLFDFRGLLIRLGQRAGLIYEYDWHIRQNPQALRNGSRILTPTGWKAIESLVIGSKAIGSDGKAINVVGVHPQGVRPMYRVKTSDGDSVDCDGRHLWTVSTTLGINTGKKVTLRTEDMASRGLFMPSGDPRFYLPIMGGPAHIDCGESLPLHPYTLGALLGDGMLSSRGTVGICTQSGIVKRMPLPPGCSIRMLPKSEKGNDVASWHILGDGRTNPAIDAIRTLGLDGLRAWEKFIPDRYLFGNEQCRRDVLAGLIDTDGGNKRKGGIKYHTTSLRLAEGFRFLVESLGGMCSLIRRTGGAYTHNGEEKTGRDIYELTPRLRDGICPFRYQPKADAWKPSTMKLRRAIVSIEPVGDAPCTCITVDAPDGLFVTEGCIVTHNSQALRTRSHALQFAGLEKDRAASRGALGDYVIKFRAPGDNAVPVVGQDQVSRNDWIDWAEGSWDDIKQTDTLNTAAAKREEDTRHICPFALPLLSRLIRLFSNPGEVVFDPFMGIGSVGHEAARLGRLTYGCELRPDWAAEARKNIQRGERKRAESMRTLFDAPADTDDGADAPAMNGVCHVAAEDVSPPGLFDGEAL